MADAETLTPNDRLRELDAAQAAQLLDAAVVVEMLSEGVAVVDDQLQVIWGNTAFCSWHGSDLAGRPIAELFRGPMGSTAVADLFAAARLGQPAALRFPCGEDRWVDLRVSPAPGSPPRFVVQLHDVTFEERRRQKLAALHHAGRALNNLDADQLAEMSVEERTEVLKHNIRQFIHQLLQYDTIEIRLLDRSTGQLVPLLSDGMTPVAAERELFAKEERNGVTGYVAATGRSYLCHDTTVDPHYILGAEGAKSSLTVPLLFGDEVIGTFNVESPRPNAFSEQDLQFTETFAREIAQALHTLQLLEAEKSCTASASVAAVNCEVALPTDAILNHATKLLYRSSAMDADTEAHLRGIIANVRTIKDTIRDVGAALAPPRVENAREAALKCKLHGWRVLIVDSDERVRRSAHAMLGKYGCQVETARSGAEAVDMASAGTYDAFLLDIRLPDGSAYEAYRRIRALQPTAIPLMMTSFGYDSAHSIVKARGNGLRAVLFKPFRADQVLDALLQSAPAVPVAATVV